MVLFLVTLNIPNPDFKVTVLFRGEYLFKPVNFVATQSTPDNLYT